MIKKKEEKTITISELKHELSTVENRILDKVSGDISSLRNDVVTKLDRVMGELEKAREDRVFAKAKDDEQDQRLVSLEGRMQKVEVKVG